MSVRAQSTRRESYTAAVAQTSSPANNISLDTFELISPISSPTEFNIQSMTQAYPGVFTFFQTNIAQAKHKSLLPSSLSYPNKPKTYSSLKHLARNRRNLISSSSSQTIDLHPSHAQTHHQINTPFFWARQHFIP